MVANQMVHRELARAGAEPASAAAITGGPRACLLRVYNYMAAALALTGAVACHVATSGFYPPIAGTPLLWIALLAPLALMQLLGNRRQ